ncbi:hypothetical protein D3C85_1141450 [compost metagenome]
MFTPQQRVRTGNVEVIGFHFLRADHMADVGDHAAAIRVREAATAVVDLAVGIAFAMGVRRFELPTAAQLVIEIGERGFVLERPRAPGRSHVGRAPEVGLAAVGVPVRHGAPGCALHVFVLIVVTHRQHRVVRQVCFQDPVTDFSLLLVFVPVRIAVAIGHHAASAQAAVEGQRTTDVEVAVVIVIAAAADTGLGFPLRSRAFAHHVDGG